MQFYKKCVFFACVALGATVNGQATQPVVATHATFDSQYVTTEIGKLGRQAQKIWQLSHPDLAVPTVKATALKAPQRADEATYTVTPVLKEYPEMGLRPGQYAFAFPTDDAKDLYQAYYFDPDFSIPFSLPAGTYDFALFFWGEETDGLRCIFKEGVEVNSDMEITAEPTDATEHIMFRPLLANGERIRMEMWKEISPDKWEMTDPGNCKQAEYYTAFEFNDYNFMTFQMNIADRFDENGNVLTGSLPGDVWITPSEKLSVYQRLAVVEEEGNSLIVMAPDDLASQEVSNSLENYTSPIKAKFAECLNMPEIEYGPYDPNPYMSGCIGFVSFAHEKYSGCNRLAYGGMTWNDTTFRICPDPINAPTIQMLPQIEKIFAVEWNTYPIVNYSIVAPVYSYSDNKWCGVHQNSIFTNNSCLEVAGYPKGGEIDILINPFYSVSPSEDIVFGGNTPVTAFLRPGDVFDYSFIGRYGEVRTIDFYSNSISVKCDGEEVCSGYSALGEFWQSEVATKNGNWVIEIDNKNIMVDGLQGCNHCVMDFVKGPKGLTPTVMQMQMRTADDNVTDKFADAGNALLTFYAGAFNFKVNNATKTQWFEYEPLDEVAVEYAPYGSEEFMPLEVSEDSDRFFMPGYGAYYRSELSQIDRQSETGWFDVRISLKDSQGNTQVQTVSPAFRIDSLTGVESVESGDISVRVEGRNIIAPEDAKVFDASGMQTGTRNLAPGIYFVRIGTVTAKCIIPF